MKPQRQGAADEVRWSPAGPCRWEAAIGGRRVAITQEDHPTHPYRVEVLDGRRAGQTDRLNTMKAARMAAERMAG